MNKFIFILSLFSLFLISSVQASDESEACAQGFDFELQKLRSDEMVNLCQYSGKPLLVINTASHCGFTPQFKELEAIHQRYKDQGLVVLGFPSDSFNQEAATEAEIAEVCYINYGVTFTMFEPVVVKGADAHPFFARLSEQSREPGWNFYKYLVDSDGNVVEAFSNRVSPASSEFTEVVEQIL